MGQDLYRINDLDCIPNFRGRCGPVGPLAVNRDGIVVGLAVEGDFGDSIAFRWSDGVLEPLFDGPSEASDINDQGLICGYIRIYSADIPSTWLGGTEPNHLEMLEDWRDARALAVNETGKVVGFARTEGFQKLAALWDEGGAVTLNDRLMPGSDWDLHEAVDINDNGWIVGEGNPGASDTQRAFLLIPSGDEYEVIDLGALPGYAESYAEAVSNDGQVLVQSSAGYDQRAGVWDNGELIELEGIGGGERTFASDLSDNGSTIIGFIESADGMPVRWTNDRLESLNDLVGDPGFDISSVESIDGRGHFIIAGGGDTNRGFLLTPATLEAGPARPGIAGQVNVIEVSGATSSAGLFLVLGVSYQDYVEVPGCDGLGLSLKRPTLVASTMADEDGVAEFSGLVPGGFGDRTVFYQVVEPSTCRASNLRGIRFE